MYLLLQTGASIYISKLNFLSKSQVSELFILKNQEHKRVFFLLNSLAKLNLVLIHNFIFLCMRSGILRGWGKKTVHECKRNQSLFARVLQQSHKHIISTPQQSHLAYEEKAKYSGKMSKECVCK